jgi:hypothetical protein
MANCDSSVNVDKFKANSRLLWRLGPLNKLQQHAARAFGMQEDAPPLGGRSWCLVKRLRPGGAKFRQRAVDIWHFQADVMQPTAALLQEAGDTAFWIGWFEQFDLTSIRATEREKCYTYAFLGEIEHTRRHDTEHITIKLERGIQVAYDYGNVVNALHAL